MKSLINAPSQLVGLAEIARPHGLQGELRLRLYNRDSNLLLQVSTVMVEFPSKSLRELKVVRARRANDAILVFLEGCADRITAETFRGAQVLVPRSLFPALKSGEFYVCDVEGATVEISGEIAGTVEGFRSYPTCDVLLVQTPDGHFEVPLVEAMVEHIDFEKRVVRVASRDALEPA